MYIRLILTVVLMLIALGCSSQNQAQSTQQLEKLLERIDNSRAKMERQKATADLKQMGTSVLPQLLELVKREGDLESTDMNSALDMRNRLWIAFQVLGTNALPLLGALKTELISGHSPGVAALGLSQLGPDGGLVLINAMTNSRVRVRTAAVSMIVSFKDDPHVAGAALEPLLACLNDDSPTLRSSAATGLGRMRKQVLTSTNDCVMVIQSLLSRAEKDDSIVVRICALHSIGAFGTNALPIEASLKRLLNSETSKEIKKSVKLALDAVQGTVISDPTKANDMPEN